MKSKTKSLSGFFACLQSNHKPRHIYQKKGEIKSTIHAHLFCGWRMPGRAMINSPSISLKSPRVFVSNHMSVLETFLFPSLQRNVSVLVFPQTTRGLRFDPDKFNTLGIKLARRAKVPVIPVAVKADAWGVGRWVRDIGRIDPSKLVRVRVSFRKPVHISGNGEAEHRATIDLIKTKLAGWQ